MATGPKFRCAPMPLLALGVVGLLTAAACVVLVIVAEVAFGDGPFDDYTPAQLAAEVGDIERLESQGPLSSSERQGVAVVGVVNTDVSVLEWVSERGGYDPQPLLSMLLIPRALRNPPASSVIATAERLEFDGADLCRPLDDRVLEAHDVSDAIELARIEWVDVAEWLDSRCGT